MKKWIIFVARIGVSYYCAGLALLLLDLHPHYEPAAHFRMGLLWLVIPIQAPFEIGGFLLSKGGATFEMGFGYPMVLVAVFVIFFYLAFRVSGVLFKAGKSQANAVLPSE